MVNTYSWLYILYTYIFRISYSKHILGCLKYIRAYSGLYIVFLCISWHYKINIHDKLTTNSGGSPGVNIRYNWTTFPSPIDPALALDLSSFNPAFQIPPVKLTRPRPLVHYLPSSHIRHNTRNPYTHARTPHPSTHTTLPTWPVLATVLEHLSYWFTTQASCRPLVGGRQLVKTATYSV